MQVNETEPVKPVVEVQRDGGGCLAARVHARGGRKRRRGQREILPLGERALSRDEKNITKYREYDCA